MGADVIVVDLGAQVVLCTPANKHMCSSTHAHKQETSPPALQFFKDCQSGRGRGMECHGKPFVLHSETLAG